MGYGEELEYWSSMGLTGFDREAAANGSRFGFGEEDDEPDCDEEETDETL